MEMALTIFACLQEASLLSEPRMVMHESCERCVSVARPLGIQRVVGTAGLPRSPLQGWHTHPPAAMSSGSKQPPSQESCPWLRRATLPGRLGPPLFPLAAPSHQPLANWDSLQKPAFVDWSKARLQGDHTAAQQRPSASPF